MIELRWLVKEVELSTGRFDGSLYKAKRRFLQYRQGTYPFQAPHDKKWSGTDWQDVPEVSDADL